MIERYEVAVPAPPVMFFSERELGLPAVVVVSTARAGDLRPGREGSKERRCSIVAKRWHYTTQVHGGVVVHASRARQSTEADALVGVGSDGVLAMFAADCALIGLVSPEGVLGVAHCGWRGLRAGVIDNIVEEMRRDGASYLVAVRSPCIGAECYEFDETVLDELSASCGAELVATTAWGRPGLDLGAGVRGALQRAGVDHLIEIDACTACAGGWFSHRARRDLGRFCLAVTGRDR